MKITQSSSRKWELACFGGYFEADEKDAVADTIIAKQLKVYFALHSLESWENV